MDAKAYINHVADVLGDAYTLGDGAKSILQRTLASCQRSASAVPSVADLLKTLEDTPAKLIFLEEVHPVMYRQQHKTKESFMEMLFRQCRELGVSFGVIDQHPHLMSSAALGNRYTTVCLNQKDPADISRAAALSLVGESEKRHLSMLPVGYGVGKLQDRCSGSESVRKCRD